MKIAIMGTRGIPAHYGGFETFAEQLSERLAKRGHKVTVYGRVGRVGDAELPAGVRSVLLPAVRQKHLETVSNTVLSGFHAAFNSYDAVIICNVANSIVLPFYKLIKTPSLVCVDGLEEKREKWGLVARMWLRASKKLAGTMSSAIIADAEVIQKHWESKAKVPVEMVTYGVADNSENSTGQLQKLGLKRDQYFLYASRLEPENNAELVIHAFEKVETDKKLVIVGDAPYAKRYISGLKSTRDKRIIFTGAVYGSGYKQLHNNCFAYIQATEVGGTHPALLEGLAWSPCVIAHKTKENEEVAADAALYFNMREADDLAHQMRTILDAPEIRKNYMLKARKRIDLKYQWDRVVDQYEQIISDIVKA